jgi:myosin heavy subunit
MHPCMCTRRRRIRTRVRVPRQTADSARKRCEELVKAVLVPIIAHAKGIPGDTIQFGKTKVFLRKNAYDALEMLRSRRLLDSAVAIQAIVRVSYEVYFQQYDTALYGQQ